MIGSAQAACLTLRVAQILLAALDRRRYALIAASESAPAGGLPRHCGLVVPLFTASAGF